MGAHRTMCQLAAYKGGGAAVQSESCTGDGPSSTFATCEPSSVLYCLEQGTYIWSLLATDHAGMTTSPALYVLSMLLCLF